MSTILPTRRSFLRLGYDQGGVKSAGYVREAWRRSKLLPPAGTHRLYKDCKTTSIGIPGRAVYLDLAAFICAVVLPYANYK